MSWHPRDLLLPSYSVIDGSQPQPPCRIDGFHEGDASVQMLLPMLVSVAILTYRTMTHAIGEYRLQAVEIRSPHIHSLVCDQPGKVLPHALAHNARFAVVN